MFSIVVLTSGYIYVGDIERDGERDDRWVITNARNIRYWGTERGLGQLALEGPTPKTRLDNVGTVRAMSHAIIHTIDTDADLWPK